MPPKKKHRRANNRFIILKQSNSRRKSRKQKGKGGYTRKQRGRGRRVVTQIGKGKVKDFFKKLAHKASVGIRKLSHSKLAAQAANSAKDILMRTGENILSGQNPRTAVKLGAKQFGESVGANLLNTFVSSIR